MTTPNRYWVVRRLYMGVPMDMAVTFETTDENEQLTLITGIDECGVALNLAVYGGFSTQIEATELANWLNEEL